MPAKWSMQPGAATSKVKYLGNELSKCIREESVNVQGKPTVVKEKVRRTQGC